MPRAPRQVLPPELSVAEPSQTAAYKVAHVTDLQPAEIPPVAILIQRGARLPQKIILL